MHRLRFFLNSIGRISRRPPNFQFRFNSANWSPTIYSSQVAEYSFHFVPLCTHHQFKLSKGFGHHLASIKNADQEVEAGEEPGEETKTLSDEIFEKDGFNLCQIIGNFNKAFVICSFNENIYLIDQHAASEKSLYVRFIKQKNLLPQSYDGKPFQIQNIYREVLQQEENILKKLGWTYLILKDGPVFLTAQLTSAPSILDRQCCETEFLQIIQSFHQNSIEDLSKSQKNSMAAIACHNAYRVGDGLSRNDMRELVDTLFQMTGAYNCPHNRPIVILVGRVRRLKEQIRDCRKYSLW